MTSNNVNLANTGASRIQDQPMQPAVYLKHIVSTILFISHKIKALEKRSLIYPANTITDIRTVG